MVQLKMIQSNATLKFELIFHKEYCVSTPFYLKNAVLVTFICMGIPHKKWGQ
jgi:hypothetical protein